MDFEESAESFLANNHSTITITPRNEACQTQNVRYTLHSHDHPRLIFTPSSGSIRYCTQRLLSHFNSLSDKRNFMISPTRMYLTMNTFRNSLNSLSVLYQSLSCFAFLFQIASRFVCVRSSSSVLEFLALHRIRNKATSYCFLVSECNSSIQQRGHPERALLSPAVEATRSCFFAQVCPNMLHTTPLSQRA